MADSSESTKTQTEIKPSKLRTFFENVFSFGLALLLVFMIRSSVVEAFKIPSGSMIPTLLVGDHIFVNKFAYGFKIPFSEWLADEPTYVIKRDPPKRGDIIVFIYPLDDSLHYIKRVIGVPGDIIEIRNKVIHINGEMVKQDPAESAEAQEVFEELDKDRYNPASLEVHRETLGTEPHLMMIDRNNFLGETFGPVTVPEDSLFVMGDNRDFSNDSRFWGFVPMKNVRGKAMVIWLSLWIESLGTLPEFRPSRIGTVLK